MPRVSVSMAWSLVSRWWDRRRCGARADSTSRSGFGVMTVRSDSHLIGPSLVLGV